MNAAMRWLSLLVVLSILAFGCSSSTGNTGDSVRVERFFTQSFTPAANPETDETTPTELNQARVVRYVINEDPTPAPRAIVIAVPGFLGGGPSSTERGALSRTASEAQNSSRG